MKNAFMSDDYLQEDWRPHIGPSGWHDLDMFALGPQFATATSSCPNKLTPDEQITHMTASALYPSPIILSRDLDALSHFELRLFGNEEVIAIDQDRLGKPATRMSEERSQMPGSRQPRAGRAGLDRVSLPTGALPSASSTWRTVRMSCRSICRHSVCPGAWQCAISGSAADLDRVRIGFPFRCPPTGRNWSGLSPDHPFGGDEVTQPSEKADGTTTAASVRATRTRTRCLLAGPRSGAAFFHVKNTRAYNRAGSGKQRPPGQW